MTGCDVMCFSSAPDCLVCLLSPTVNLWTMFQAAQKLGGYELVSIHICADVLLLLCQSPSLLSSVSPSFSLFFIISSSLCLPTSLLSSLSFLLLPSFYPLRSVTVFPRRKSCSEPHLAKMMPLFQNPLGVENTCSSALRWSEGNWSNRSFFPMLAMKWNAHTVYTRTCTTKVSQMCETEAFHLAAPPAVYSFTIHVRRVSKVKSMFDVKSSSVLLMPVSSLARRFNVVQTDSQTRP